MYEDEDFDKFEARLDRGDCNEWSMADHPADWPRDRGWRHQRCGPPTIEMLKRLGNVSGGGVASYELRWMQQNAPQRQANVWVQPMSYFEHGRVRVEFQCGCESGIDKHRWQEEIEEDRVHEAERATQWVPTDKQVKGTLQGTVQDIESRMDLLSMDCELLFSEVRIEDIMVTDSHTLVRWFTRCAHGFYHGEKAPCDLTTLMD